MRVFEVENLAKVDVTRYKNGDLFLSKQSMALIHNGKMETLVKQSEVRKIIREEVRKELKKHAE